MVRARSIAVCDGALSSAPPPNVTCFEIPTVASSQRARIEVVFDPGRTLDGWTCQVLEEAAHLAALLLEIERAHGRAPQFARVRDDAAPLIGSSQAISARSLPDRARRGHRFHGSDRRHQVHSRTPVLLHFQVALPSVAATGRWRKRGRMRRRASAPKSRTGV